MADIELEYGPGASIAILKQSLKALGLKSKLQVEVREVDSGMDDALELRVGEGAGQEGMHRLERMLQMCIRILAKRHVKMSANLGDRTIAIEIPPRPIGRARQSSDQRLLQGTLSHPLTTRDHSRSQTKIAATRFTGTAAWGQPSTKPVAIFVPEHL